MSKKKIILASSSPRRRNIMNGMGLVFEVIPSDYDEFLEDTEFDYEKIETIAFNKAESVAVKVKEPAIIVSADTVVVFDNQILGKPKNEQHALEMLKSLSGQRHFVVTSICAIDTSSLKKHILSTTSYVEFEDLYNTLIEEYVATYSPLDKAGAYGIQELPVGFVKSVEGSFENIIGLCPKALSEVLKTFS